MSLFELCRVDELVENTPHECQGPNEESIVVIAHQGQFYAVAGDCPHQAAPMVDAEVSNGNIMCCLHFWTWRLDNGQPVEEADVNLPTYPIIVKDGRILLKSDDP